MFRPDQRMRRLTALLAAALLTGCSSYQALSVVGSRDPSRAARLALESRVESYRSNPLLLVSDARSARRRFRQVVALFQGRVAHEWGRDDAQVAGPKRYVKYTQNYLSRAVVDFDSGLITVETLDDKHPTRSLRNAIVTTLLTPEDPRAVDLYSAGTVRLSGRPYLAGLVLDAQGRTVTTPGRAEAFADQLLAGYRQTRSARGEAGTRTVNFVQLYMVKNHADLQARRYASLVARNAKRFGVSRSLVFAVIKTESNFNPFAVSSAPAFGLMQLVPETGGRDAYREVYGRARVPSRDYLFDPAHNIELGTAYLGLIEHRYFAEVRDPVSREYCAIAAYNTGAGNVLRAFAADRGRAVKVINSLPPGGVLWRLKTRLRPEPKRYVVKVLEARRDYARL